MKSGTPNVEGEVLLSCGEPKTVLKQLVTLRKKEPDSGKV